MINVMSVEQKTIYDVEEGQDWDDVDLSGAINFHAVEAQLQLLHGVETAAVIEYNHRFIAFVAPQHLDTDFILAEMKTRMANVDLAEAIALPTLVYTRDGRIDYDHFLYMRTNKHIFHDKPPREELKLDTKELTLPQQPPKIKVKEVFSGSSSSSVSDVSTDCKPYGKNRLGEDGGDWMDYTEAHYPDKKASKYVRNMRHIIGIVYRRLFAIIFLANMGVFVWCAYVGATVGQIATATVANLFASIIIRQEYVVNFLFVITGMLPRSAPLAIRKQCAKVYHMGGIHSGCGVSGAVWVVYLAIKATIDSYKKSSSDSSRMVVSQSFVAVTWAALALLFIMVIAAYPWIRNKYHDRFEQFHRFAGWTAIAILWAQILILTRDSVAPGQSYEHLLVRTSAFWMVLIMTVSIILPWARLRKVTVRPERLSNHAIRFHFTNRDRPVPGSFYRISDRPLYEWHSFATVAVPDKSGFSMVVSRAGDWTQKVIDEQPTTFWVRGVPTRGVMNVSTRFNRVVLVGTGSGIGPCLPVLLAAKKLGIAVRMVWCASNIRATFGDAIVDSVLGADPGAYLVDTKKHGRPDLTKLVYMAQEEFNAEAVVIIANTTVTKKVVYGLESRGVTAYGAIWDS